MKASSLVVLLSVALSAVAIFPTTYALENSAALAEEQGEQLAGTHIRRLSEEQPEELPEMKIPGSAVEESDENHAWWHRGDRGGWHGGGCSPGSRFWPRCKSYRRLEKEPLSDDELQTEVDENHAPWHGGGRGGGCFPGSRMWPRCRGWGCRGDCFPGSRFWPRCRSF